HRYLWNPAAVDQLLADELVDSLESPGIVRWAFLDHQGSVRDIGHHNSATHVTAVIDHRSYDTYGTVVSETDSTVVVLIGFTGRPFDASTGLQNNLNRWYASDTGLWVSEDPASFGGQDTNLTRY